MRNTQIKIAMDKYKRIYETRVLPKKSVTINAEDAYNAHLRVFEDFAPLRKKANEVVFGGDKKNE